MLRKDLRTALREIAGVWDVHQNDLLSRFHRRELDGSARLEPLDANEARGLLVNTPAFRITIEGKQTRLLYLVTCKRLSDRNQKSPRLVMESRHREFLQDGGLTATTRRCPRLRGRLPAVLFPPLRESRVPAPPVRATRDR